MIRFIIYLALYVFERVELPIKLQYLHFAFCKFTRKFINYYDGNTVKKITQFSVFQFCEISVKIVYCIAQHARKRFLRQLWQNKSFLNSKYPTIQTRAETRRVVT